LFTYSRGKTHSDYQEPNFTPSFVIPAPNEEAKEVCGNDTSCLYDYHTTGGDVHIARSTRAVSETFVEMKIKNVVGTSSCCCLCDCLCLNVMFLLFFTPCAVTFSWWEFRTSLPRIAMLSGVFILLVMVWSFYTLGRAFQVRQVKRLR